MVVLLQGYMYYINDGVYGSFNCLVFDHAIVEPKTLKETDGNPLYPSSIWGPTCDSFDCITKSVALPKVERYILFFMLLVFTWGYLW
jgi:ornithine decarboxylase